MQTHVIHIKISSNICLQYFKNSEIFHRLPDCEHSVLSPNFWDYITNYIITARELIQTQLNDSANDSPLLSQEAVTPEPSPRDAQTDDSDDDTPDLELSSCNKDTFILEVWMSLRQDPATLYKRAISNPHKIWDLSYYNNINLATQTVTVESSFINERYANILNLPIGDAPGLSRSRDENNRSEADGNFKSNTVDNHGDR